MARCFDQCRIWRSTVGGCCESIQYQQHAADTRLSLSFKEKKALRACPHNLQSHMDMPWCCARACACACPPSGMRSAGFAASAPTPHCACASLISAPSLDTSASCPSSLLALLPPLLLLLSEGCPTPLTRPLAQHGVKRSMASITFCSTSHNRCSGRLSLSSNV